MSRAMARSLLWLPLLGACAYYNAMWSAERLAKEARRLEQHGRGAEARSAWARAAVKAETVLVRHPSSRWADDALVLRGEALARSGNCPAAVQPLGRALGLIATPELTERAALAAGECALQAGQPGRALQLLEPVTGSGDGRRRSRATFLAGQAAVAVGDPRDAADRFARSDEPGASAARARALVAAGAADQALASIDHVAHQPFVESEWAALMEALALDPGVGPVTASGALDRLLDGQRIPAGSRARLLLADGDRLRVAGRLDEAGARYRSVVDLVPDSSEAALAAMRDVQTRVARVTEVGDLGPLRRELEGTGREEARALARTVAQVMNPEGGEAARFRAAELARDSLAAPLLAGRLFLQFAAEYPQSLFAPKALLATVSLIPDRSDSVLATVASTYPRSPYTLALQGEISPAYAAAEDSLAKALGLAERAPQVAEVRVASPVPGRRGPALDPALAAPPEHLPARSPPPSQRAAPRPARPAVPDRQ